LLVPFAVWLAMSRIRRRILDTDCKALGKEFAALKEQITYVSDNTKFNGRELLKGGDDINIQTYDGSA
ncbi:hypothetical protein ACT453_42880, partial [Bacillus sp. D-CC]